MIKTIAVIAITFIMSVVNVFVDEIQVAKDLLFDKNPQPTTIEYKANLTKPQYDNMRTKLYKLYKASNGNEVLLDSTRFQRSDGSVYSFTVKTKNFAESQQERNVTNKKVKEIAKLASVYQTEKEKVRFVNNYLVEHTEYSMKGYNSSNTLEKRSYASAYSVLEKKEGICEGYTNAFTLIMEELDIPVVEVVTDDHTWNKVYIDGKWLHVDVTWNDPIVGDGFSQEQLDFFKEEYLLKTDEEMTSMGKVWDKELEKRVIKLKYPKLSK